MKLKNQNIILTLALVLVMMVLLPSTFIPTAKAQGGRVFFQGRSISEYSIPGLELIASNPSRVVGPLFLDIGSESFVYLPLVCKQQVNLPPDGPALEGSWTGDSITDGFPSEVKPVAFFVEAEGKRIAPGARIDTYYKKTSGIWTCYGTIKWTIDKSISITPDGSFYISGGLIDKLTWDGNFVSYDKAEGTFHIEVQTYLCGKAIHDGTWTATWQGP
jgi:hypothetical protein